MKTDLASGPPRPPVVWACGRNVITSQLDWLHDFEVMIESMVFTRDLAVLQSSRRAFRWTFLYVFGWVG